MHFPTHQVSRIERVASFAAATGVTVGTALLIFAELVPSFVRTPVAEPALDSRQLSEHVVYVGPRVPPPAVVPTRQAGQSSARSDSRPVIKSAARAQVTTSPFDNASIDEATDPRGRTTPTVPASPSRAAAGAPVAGAMVGFTHASREPVRFDSAVRSLNERLATGLVTRELVPPPPTQAERDAKWRDEAFEAVAARGSGTPIRRTMAGGSIPVPLPFGGPSRKQRERDRAIYAELKATVALRQKRVDSLVAARRRRADSLARIPDSVHRGTAPQE